MQGDDRINESRRDYEPHWKMRYSGMSGRRAVDLGYLIARIETILSRQQVSQELAQCFRKSSPESIRKAAELICSRGICLLMILLCKTAEKRQALELLLMLLKEGVSDADLPFARVPLSIPFGP